MQNKNLIKVFTKIDSELSKTEQKNTKGEPSNLFKIFQKIPEGEKGIKIFQPLVVPQNEVNIEEKSISETHPLPIISPDVKQVLAMTTKELCGKDGYGNFQLRLLRRIREIDKGNDNDIIKIYYEFEIILRNGEKYVVKIPGTQVHNTNWISEYTGGAAYINYTQNARKEVAQMIRDMIDYSNYLYITVFNQNGWKLINGNWNYVIDSGIIGKNEAKIFGDKKHPFYFKKENVGTFEIFAEAFGMKNICNDTTITTPLFLFTHCGPLCKLFELAGVPLKFVLAVIGATNSRKTSMALCMTKTFCRDNIFKPEVSFDATQGGVEVESSKHSDSVLVIDDFHPAISKREQTRMTQLLEFILRRYGDRVTKKRMMDFSPNKVVSSYNVEGVCVITGEDITGVQSSLTRCLVLEVDRESVNNELLAYYQKKSLILTTHMYDFIDYITQNFNELVSYIGPRVMAVRESSTYEIPRFCEYFSQLSVVAEIIAKYAIQRGFWNDNNVLGWLQECTQTLDYIIRKNLLGIIREDFAAYIVQALKVGLEEYGCCNVEELPSKKLSREEIAEDEKFFFIQVDFLMELTRRYWLRLSKDLPFSSKKQMTLFLEQKGLILVRKEGENIRRTLPLPKGKQRVLYIKKDQMKELLEKVEL